MAKSPKLIDLDGEIVVSREAAVLFRDHDTGEKVWLPKSQIEIDHRDEHVVVTLPEWLAIEKGLI